MAEASDFKFGTQLGFAKAHYKITPIGKSGYGLGLGELPKILGFPLIFELATSNLACSWGWPRPAIKTRTRGKKWEWPWARQTPKYFGFPFNISATAVLSS